MQNICTIIVTYNGSQWIEKCIRSLLQSSLSSKIIVVDNCSTDNTLSLLKSSENSIELIQTEKNIGFGGGNNIGIKKAMELHADYVFLLNQDAYVDQFCIQRLTEALKQNPSFGILSPLQMNSSGIELDEAFNKYVASAYKEDLSAIKKEDCTSQPFPVRFVNAAAWMISKPAIEATGLFHPVFFHYGEDNNYCSRMQYHNFKVGILASASVIHDRENKIVPKEKLLIQQLRVVPLYTLLDIRKPFILAYFLALQKLKRIHKKLQAFSNNQSDPIYIQQKEWFNKKIKEALSIRKETKKRYLHNNM